MWSVRATFTVSLAIVAMLTPIALGCSPAGDSSPPPVCFDTGIDPSCTPAYEPTFDALYEHTFQGSCAASGVSCHASTGRQAGVDFGDPDSAYASLVRGNVVRPHEPECSTLVERIIATTGDVRMPPGRSLPVEEQCAIVKWISEGARR